MHIYGYIEEIYSETIENVAMRQQFLLNVQNE